MGKIIPMKLKNFNGTIMVVILFVIFGLRLIRCANGEQTQTGNIDGRTADPKQLLDLRGVVFDMTPDLSNNHFEQLEHIGSPEEAEQVLKKILTFSTPSNAVVTLKGDVVAKETVCNAKGEFNFADLPKGVYDLSAKALVMKSSETGEKRYSLGGRQIRVGMDGEHVAWIRINISAYSVNVRGRICDVTGHPLSGVRVVGKLTPSLRNQEPDMISTISNFEGHYELIGIVAPNLWSIACYLTGGNPVADHKIPFFVDIRAEAAGYDQQLVNDSKVPLITEELLHPARRLSKIIIANSEHLTEKEKRNFKERELPDSTGNTITGIDIVLEKEK